MTLKQSYDIFRRLPDGAPIWIEAVPNLELARVRVACLIRSDPGEYLIYDLSRGQIVAHGADSLKPPLRLGLEPIRSRA
jgi:hypothetical protein